MGQCAVGTEEFVIRIGRGVATTIVVALLAWHPERLAAQADTTAPLLSFLQVGPHIFGFADGIRRINGTPAPYSAAELSDVRRALGETTKSDTGDASSSTAWLCYRLSGVPKVTLVVESGEMGGGQWITEFELFPVGTRKDLEHGCRDIAIAGSDVVTDTRLQLGLTRQQVIGLLGTSMRDSADAIIYERSVHRKNVDGSGKVSEFDEGSWLTIRFRNGRVIAFHGGRIDST
jgi:hypothetical protein